jgi:hypothetical protein
MICECCYCKAMVMNEFTKEELKDIHYDLMKNENPWTCGDTIINKIKLMIDNYCYHKKDVTPLYTSTGDIPIAGFCYECGFPVDKKYLNP